MKAVSQIEAQKRADQIRIFQKELQRIEQEGALVLTADQRRALEEHHRRILSEFSVTFDIDQTDKARQLSLGMKIASFLGALALAVDNGVIKRISNMPFLSLTYMTIKSN